MFLRRRRKSVLCLVGLVALMVYFAGFGVITGGQSDRWSLSLSEVQGDDISHNPSGAASTTQLLTRKAKDQKHQQEDQEAFNRLMSERKNQVLKVCQTQHPNPRYFQNKVVIVNRAQRFLHCPITKAASTFWGRFLLTLNISGPMKSPFIHQLKFNTPLPRTYFSDLREQDRLQLLNSSFKSLFVRDPYHRMLSAYVDKILGPNPTFWKEWGKHWWKVSRQPPSQRRPGRIVSYHNITFSQVMTVAAATFHRSELHFVPASVCCDPCEFRYDFIGKMETFPRDLRRLSEGLNLSLTDYFSSQDFAFHYAKDAIEDSVYSPFSWLSEILRCIDKFQMGLRIWRKLQIRGLVDRRIPFPYSREAFQSVGGSQLVAAAVQAHRNSTDRTQLQRQKREAFVEAYRTVDLKALQKLRDVFNNDFLMFGYDPVPPDVFDRSQPLNVTGAFDWSIPWTGGA